MPKNLRRTPKREKYVVFVQFSPRALVNLHEKEYYKFLGLKKRARYDKMY